MESFNSELYEALRNIPGTNIALFGGGTASGSPELRVLKSMNLEGWLAKNLARIMGKTPDVASALGFGIRLLPQILRERPQVIMVCDRAAGHLLYHFRELTQTRFRLLLHNGSPVRPPYPHWDHVHHPAPVYYDAALAAGEPSWKHSMLPLPARFPSEPLLNGSAISALRRRLAIPDDRLILLSVGAVNRWHKRMDYVVAEVARLPAEKRPFLLLLGQSECETREVVAQAEQSLGQRNFIHRTVRSAEVHDYYRLADIFTLASLTEGFGRVYVEALGHGLPCLVDDNPVTRFVLGDDGEYGEFAKLGALAQLLLTRMANPRDAAWRRARSALTRRRFSWELLAPKYLRMFERAASPVPA